MLFFKKKKEEKKDITALVLDDVEQGILEALRLSKRFRKRANEFDKIFEEKYSLKNFISD